MTDQPASIRSWACGRLSEEVRRTLDRLARTRDVRHIAIMPDVHLARDLCVGTVFATRELIYPAAIGGDIGCGLTAVQLTAELDELSPERTASWHRAIDRAVPIHRQRSAAARAIAAEVPDPRDLSHSDLRTLAAEQGPLQLGTLGTGNHFLEVQHDEDDQLWLMVHSGSRGLGQAIRDVHEANATERSGGLGFLEARTPDGEAYLADMDWARRFAAASRRHMLRAAAAPVSRDGWSLHQETMFECDHNHIEEEQHFGDPHFVHRKGAMAAFDGQPGMVPGSMATASHHVVGRGLADALCSSAHGAGRSMSRTEARRRVDRKRLLRELAGVHVDPRTVGGLREEAPSAYKDIRAVMKAQRKLVRVVRTMTPIFTHKGVARARP